jgi:hypothetical protein
VDKAAADKAAAVTPGVAAPIAPPAPADEVLVYPWRVRRPLFPLLGRWRR